MDNTDKITDTREYPSRFRRATWFIFSYLGPTLEYSIFMENRHPKWRRW